MGDRYAELAAQATLRHEFEKAFVKEMKWAEFVAPQYGTFRMADGEYLRPEVESAFRWFKVGRAFEAELSSRCRAQGGDTSQ